MQEKGRKNFRAPAARRTKHPLKTKDRFPTSSQMMYLLNKKCRTEPAFMFPYLTSLGRLTYLFLFL